MQGPLFLQAPACPPQLRHLSRLKHRYLAFEERTRHQPIKATYYLPTILVLYNTLDPDVALAYLPTATVMIAVVDMIISLVLDLEWYSIFILSNQKCWCQDQGREMWGSSQSQSADVEQSVLGCAHAVMKIENLMSGVIQRITDVKISSPSVSFLKQLTFLQYSNVCFSHTRYLTKKCTLLRG